jgi:hypothetical protein
VTEAPTATATPNTGGGVPAPGGDNGNGQ